MKEILFSIIIPVYNAEQTIERTIKELKQLDGQSYEIIFVNDGSTDRTETIIQKQIASDGRFIVLATKNQGPGLARNEGIKRAIGKYVLFFDADDYPKKTILTDYQEILEKDPKLELIISSFTFRTMNGTEILTEKDYLAEEKRYRTHEEFIEDMYELMNKQMMYVVWNKCYRRDILVTNNILFKDYSSCEDRIFNLDYYKFCTNVYLNPKIEYIYEFEGGKGITNKYKENKFDTFKEFYEQSNEVMKNNSIEGMAALHLKGTTSVIFSILETDQLTRKEKREKISAILNDPTLVKAKQIANTDTKAKKITKLLYNTPKFLFLSVLSIGSYVEVHFPRLMSTLKRVY